MTLSKAVVGSVIVLVVSAPLMSDWSVRGARSQGDVAPTFKKEFAGQQRGFSRAVVVQSGRVKTIYLAGTGGAGRDFKAQTIAAFEGLVKQLEAVGGKKEDRVTITVYIVNLTPETYNTYVEAKLQVFSHANPPASTAVGVVSLARSEMLIEVEGIAVVGA